jgi:hypothetical protein
VNDLFRDGIVDGSNEMAYLIAHRFSGDTSGSSLEIDMACAANACVEGVAARHQGLEICHAGVGNV